MTVIFRPETYSAWTRRKARWLRRRAWRCAKEDSLRLDLVEAHGGVKLRIAHESELQFDDEARQVDQGKMPEAYLTGALELREFELTNLWSSCAAVAKALVRTEPDELPEWAEALRPRLIAMGLARWMFNALSHELPRTTDKRLPDSHAYQAHFQWLVQQSKARTMQR